MKSKTHWLRNTLIVMVCCAVLGTALAAVFFLRNENRSYAEATLQFSFNGAGEGKAPNGSPFDVGGISEGEVIAAALKASGLEGTYAADQVADSLQVTGVYPENIVNQMTQYVSLLNAGENRDASVTNYHTTIYTVKLYNDFDKSLTGAKLTGLLDSLLKAYRDWFARTSSGVLTTGLIPNLDQYDLTRQLTALLEEVSQQSRYAGEMAALAPDFRQDKTGFNDLKVQYQSLYSELQRVYAVVTVNGLSRDSENLRLLYGDRAWELKTRAEAKQEELRQVEKLLEDYQKDSTVYISTANTLEKIGNENNGAYDLLSARRDRLTAEVTALQKEAADCAALLEDMNRAAEESESTLSAVEQADRATAAGEQVRSLESRMAGINGQFASLLDGYTKREINERTVSVTKLKFKAPSLFSLAFLKAALMAAGPLCAAGLMVCLALLIRARRKEEKAAA